MPGGHEARLRGHREDPGIENMPNAYQGPRRLCLPQASGDAQVNAMRLTQYLLKTRQKILPLGYSGTVDYDVFGFTEGGQ